MKNELDEKLECACWIAHMLFTRNKVSGSAANLSFRHKNHIFITSSGTCFGTLNVSDFTELTISGEVVKGSCPSKEFALHQAFYKKDPDIGSVIHTHSFYATLWSCVIPSDAGAPIPTYTPYLSMKVGSIGIVDYAPPGSEQLFSLFRQAVQKNNAFLLKNHGPIVPGKTLMEAFYGLEELEEACHIAWELRNDLGIKKIIAPAHVNIP